MKIVLIIAAFISCLPVLSQEKAPLVSGKVSISIKQGTFECDLTLSDIPPVKEYFLRLNRGMNVLHFRDVAQGGHMIGYDISHEDKKSFGESSAYYFPGNVRGSKFLPEALAVKYVGKFPVVKDTLGNNHSRDDWKGNIAFNGYSVRTDGRQTAWFPLLYDAANDKIYENMRYDLQIECLDCNTLYINGHAPVKATSHHFKSDVPYELTLYCGNFTSREIGGTYILNSDLTPSQEQEFTAIINSYKAFYTGKLKIPYALPVTFINTTPTSAKNTWMFVAYPTIFTIGYGDNGLKSLFVPKIQNWYRPFMAHELAHYYFGTYKVFNSELGDMMSEGFAEFMAMKLTREVIGIDVYTAKLKGKVQELQDDFTPKPFSAIKDEKEYEDRELYVYNFAPVVFMAIEEEIGEKKMVEWLVTILNSKEQFTNYAFLTTTLRQALKNEKDFQRIKTTYFESSDVLANALKTLNVE